MNRPGPDSRNDMSRRRFLTGTASCLAASSALGGFAEPTAARQPAPAERDTPCAPLAMWALTGTLSSDDVKRRLDAYQQAGWAVVLYPRWGLQLEYLGPAWFDRIRFIVQQAASRQLEVWLYDEFCWPSGHAKGLVTKGHQQLEAQLLEVQQDGRCSLQRLPGSANLLLPAATKRFLQVTHERYRAAIGEYFGNCVRAIFTDEPSLAIQHGGLKPEAGRYVVPWSEQLARELDGDFPQRLASAGDVENWPGWYEYWAAYSKVFHDAWVAPIAQWCKEQNIALTGHLMGEGSFGSQVAFNGSIRRQLAQFGIPGIDEIHTRTGPERCEALTLATIARWAGRERMVEAFALGPPSLKLQRMRRMVDLCAACGVDRYVLAICPQDLRGGLFKREYLGIHGPQQPWFDQFAPLFAQYVRQAAKTARKARPLPVPWPTDEELWARSGPDPRRSAALRQLTARFVAEARQAIRDRLQPAPAVARIEPAAASKLVWAFRPKGLNSLRLDQKVLQVQHVPEQAELSFQRQLVRRLRLNGTELDLRSAPDDRQFDASYKRIDIAGLLQLGQNALEVECTEPQPLKFLPAVVLWGDFAVDQQRRIVAPGQAIRPGDWRQQGYPALYGQGCYRTTTTWSRLPTGLTVDSGGYPTGVLVNGKPVGRRAWAPFHFDLRQALRSGENNIEIQITSTIGHLMVPDESPTIGLLGVRFDYA